MRHSQELGTNMYNAPVVLQGLPYNPPQLPGGFPVPPIMANFMRTLGGFLLLNAQNAAVNTPNPINMAFWQALTNNGLNNQVFVQAFQHAAALAYVRLASNQSLANNQNEWLGGVGNYVATAGAFAYLVATNPNAAQQLDQNTVNTINQAVNEYNANISQALPMFNNAAQQQNSFGNVGGFGNPGGFGQQNSFTFGGNTGGWNTGGWNGGSFQNQMNNNQYQANNGVSFGNVQQQGGIMHSGRKVDFGAGQSNGGWPDVGNAAQLQGSGSAGNGFSSVNVQKPITTLGGFNKEQQQQIQSAPLQQFVPAQENVVTAPVTNAQSNVRETEWIKDSWLVRIPLPGGRVQRHIRFHNPKTQYSVYTVTDDNVIINQKINPLESENVEFNDHNTAQFLPSRGTGDKSIIETGLTLSNMAQQASNSKWMETVLENIKAETSVETVDGSNEVVAAAVKRIMRGSSLTVSTVLSSQHSDAYDALRQYIRTSGVDILLKDTIVTANIAELDHSAQSTDIEPMFILMQSIRIPSVMEDAFNKLGESIESHFWTKLNDRITNWINENLYVYFGLPLSIDSFASDFKDLCDVMTSAKFGVEQTEIASFTTGIGKKFFMFFNEASPAAADLEYDWTDLDPKLGITGTVSRYCFMPMYSHELNLSGNKTSAIITQTDSPDLYTILSAQLTNLQLPTEIYANSYLVTRNGDMLLVTRPSTVNHYVVTKTRPTVFVNPLIAHTPE